MDYLRLLDIIFYGFTLLVALIALVYFPGMRTRHKERKKLAVENVSKENLPEELLSLYREIVNRRYDALVDWNRVRSTKKAFGFVGVMYSIFGLAASIAPEKCTDAVAVIISVMAIICVIAALYFSTDTCIRVHIKAWRRYDEVINSFNTEISQYKSLDTNGIVNKAKELAGVIKEVEDSLSSDEE